MANIVKIENGELSQESKKWLIALEKQRKIINDEYDNFKAELLKAMEENGIVKIENEDLIISYIASGEKETFDSKSFKKDHSEMYDKYVKFTPVKSSIRIKVK